MQGRILQATLDLVAEHGFHGTSIHMIANRADIGVGSIYRYYDGKDDLIHAVYNSIEDNLENSFLAGYSEEQPVEERFVCLCFKLTTYLLKNPMAFSFLEQYLASPYGASKGNNIMISGRSWNRDSGGILYSLFKEGKSCGRIQDLPLMTLYSLTIGAIFFLLKGHNAGAFELNEMIIRKTIHSSWNAIRRNGASNNISIP